jgi:hypothetical protein
VGCIVSQNLKSQGEEGITCKDGCGFPKFTPTAGVSAPEVGIIHGRQIIVNEGIAMNHFNGGSNTRCLNLWDIKQVGARQGEHGSKALPAIFDACHHGLRKGRGNNPDGQKLPENTLNHVIGIIKKARKACDQ